MNCKACRVQIEELEEGRPLDSTARVHMESCAACLAFYKESVSLRQMIGSLEVVSAPADFDFRLRARLAAVKSDGHADVIWKRFSPGVWSLASVVLIVMIVAVGLIVRQGRNTPSDNASQVVANSNSVEKEASAPSRTEAPAVNGALKETAPPLAGDVQNQNIAGNPETKFKSVGNGTQGGITTTAADNDIDSRDSVLRSTRKTVMPPGIPDPSTMSTTSVAFPVRGSMSPVTIQINDPRSKSQNISLRRVTFGGQDVLEPGSAMPGPFSTVQGVW